MLPLLIPSLLLLAYVKSSFVPTDNIHTGFNMEATLLRNCLLYPSVLSPNLIEDNKGVDINVEIYVNQIHDLDAVSRTFSLSGVLQLSWNVPCVNRLYENTTSWPQKDLDTLHVDPKLFWKPFILHRSGYNQINLQDWQEIFLTVDMENGNFEEIFSGMFTMLCPMDFKQFPFDKQTCQIHLMSGFGIYIRFHKAKIIIMPSALQENMNWDLVGKETEIIEKGFDDNPEVFLLFNFKRKSYYYIVSLLLPGIALHFLILVSYFLPPDTTDRTVYAATIELAFYFFQIEFNRALPPSSTPLNMQIYLIGMLIGCTTITIYSAILCFIANTKPNLAKKKITLLGKRYQFIYIVDFHIFLLIFISSGILAAIPTVLSLLG